MIVSRTPFRISFFGGGTDYPAWFSKHGGAVVGASIDKYCYLTCRHLPPFFDHRVRVVYSKIENCLSADDIRHPAARECLRFLGFEQGVEVHHDGDLPARGGIGSSSAFTVGLLHALYALRGRAVSKLQLAREAIHVEQERLQEVVGCQDQILTAVGGLNHVIFHPHGEFEVHPVGLDRATIQEFNDHFLLYFTRVQRMACDIAASYVHTLEDKERELKAITQMVPAALAMMAAGHWTDFGHLLHEYWCHKRNLGDKISNEQVDSIYAAARSAGALGGKITGAGGGGYMLFFAPPSRHAAIQEALRGLVRVPFKFEYSGSHIVVYDPGEPYGDQRDLEQVKDCR